MIGFIGGGNMGEAIIKGLIQSNVYSPDKITVSDVSKERLEFLKNSYNVDITHVNKNVVKKSDILLIAVKPQIIEKVLGDIKESIDKNNHVVVSIAAGVSVGKLEGILGRDKKIVRVMPNASAFVLESMNVLCFNGNITDKEKKSVFTIFNSIGKTMELEEKYIDAVTALSGSGPGFVSVILEAFSDAGVNVGLSRDIAEKLILQTFLGTLKLATEQGKSFSEIKNMVTSPGGTTIKGIHQLEKKGVRCAIMDCVEAAFKRSSELS